MLAVAVSTPPNRTGTIRSRSSPPSAEDGRHEVSKRRGVAFTDEFDDANKNIIENRRIIREVHDYLLKEIQRVEVTANRRADELTTSGFARRTETVTNLGELQGQMRELKLEIEVMQGSNKPMFDERMANADKVLEERLAQADTKITEVVTRQQETLDALANTNSPGPAIFSVEPGFHMPGAPPASIPLKEFCDVPTKLP